MSTDNVQRQQACHRNQHPEINAHPELFEQISWLVHRYNFKAASNDWEWLGWDHPSPGHDSNTVHVWDLHSLPAFPLRPWTCWSQHLSPRDLWSSIAHESLLLFLSHCIFTTDGCLRYLPTAWWGVKTVSPSRVPLTFQHSALCICGMEPRHQPAVETPVRQAMWKRQNPSSPFTPLPLESINLAN